MSKINCFLCKHFYITWDPNFPKGCKAIGFKAKNNPSIEVFKNSGIECLKFESKKSTKKEH